MTELTTAQLENNIVTQVIVGTKEWAESRLGGTWIDTTGLQVGIGFTYHGDHFRPPQLFASWIWEHGQWTPPVPYPQDGQRYSWDESTTSWVVWEDV